MWDYLCDNVHTFLKHIGLLHSPPLGMSTFHFCPSLHHSWVMILSLLFLPLWYDGSPLPESVLLRNKVEENVSHISIKYVFWLVALQMPWQQFSLSVFNCMFTYTCSVTTHSFVCKPMTLLIPVNRSVGSCLINITNVISYK